MFEPVMHLARSLIAALSMIGLYITTVAADESSSQNKTSPAFVLASNYFKTLICREFMHEFTVMERGPQFVEEDIEPVKTSANGMVTIAFGNLLDKTLCGTIVFPDRLDPKAGLEQRLTYDNIDLFLEYFSVRGREKTSHRTIVHLAQEYSRYFTPNLWDKTVPPISEIESLFIGYQQRIYAMYTQYDSEFGDKLTCAVLTKTAMPGVTPPSLDRLAQYPAFDAYNRFLKWYNPKIRYLKIPRIFTDCNKLAP